MPLNTASYWKAVEATETVTYYRRTAEDTFTTSTVAHAKRRAPMKWEVLGDGLISVCELTWHLWADALNGVIPKVSDVIQDTAGVRWTLIKVEVNSLGQRYRCSAQKEH